MKRLKICKIPKKTTWKSMKRKEKESISKI